MYGHQKLADTFKYFTMTVNLDFQSNEGSPHFKKDTRVPFAQHHQIIQNHLGKVKVVTRIHIEQIAD